MRLAAVQFCPYSYRSPDEARMALAGLLRVAGAAGCSLIVAPELATTHYVLDGPLAANAVSEAVDGPTYTMLRDIAAAHGAWLSCGFVEQRGDVLHNSAMLVGPDGERHVYRKVRLFEADESWASPGRTWIQVATAVGSVMPLICMDLNHNPACDHVRAACPDVVAFNTAWLDEGIDVVRYWQHRLRGWAGWFVAANTWGEDPPLRFRGRSAVIGPAGVVKVVGPARGDAVIWLDTASGESRVVTGGE